MPIKVATILIFTAALLTAPFYSAAQPRGKVPRIGVLEPSRGAGGCLRGFQKGLRELGYIEGQTITVDYRFAEGNPDRLPVLAGELIRQGPDVLWTHSPSGARAVHQATTAIPIVIGVAGYLVEQGLAASFARPGGNITGFELGDIELAGKRLQLLKEAVPKITQVAVLVDPTIRTYDNVPANLEPVARSLGVRLHRIVAATPQEFENAFGLMMKTSADGLMIADVPLFVRNSERLAQLALKHRLPTISGWRRYAEAGILIAYGPNVPELCQRSAGYVERILKGTKPGALPIERPEKFELIINGSTAKALGLTIPSSIRVQADEVIQDSRGG